MKVLHLATDDKFIDHAYTVFEMAYPNENEVWVLSKSSDLKFVKLVDRKIIPVSLSKKWRAKVSKRCYQKYDIIVFHSFIELLSHEIFNIPKGIPTVWLGWGYDYYGLIDNPGNLLLPETKNMACQKYKNKVRIKSGKIFRFLLGFLGAYNTRESAIEKLTIFSPVLPNEYGMVRRSRRWQSFPEYAHWNYGTMEDHLIKGFEGEEVSGNAVLVGNSASLTCNHKETLDFLHKSGVDRRQIIVPLSYGDKVYGEKIIVVGEQYFGSRFNPLKEFMPIQDYVATIKQCGYVIMNHKRQQAVGNIVIMLYLGARLFLREENPIYPFLKDLGVTVSSVQQLEKDISLLNKPLSIQEKEVNKRLVSEYWSRESSVARTKALVERALELVNKNSPTPRGSA